MTTETPTPPDADVSPQSTPHPVATDHVPVTDGRTQVTEITQISTSRTVRILWTTGGGAAVGLGSVGIVVPGLPTTGFFILAAWCFSHSSPRFERWVLNLPKIGPMVADHRVGLGMPRKAKVIAISMIWFFSLLSTYLMWGNPWFPFVVLGLAAFGTAYILWKVPTREKVLADRAAAGEVGQMIVVVEEITVTKTLRGTPQRQP